MVHHTDTLLLEKNKYGAMPQFDRVNTSYFACFCHFNLTSFKEKEMELYSYINFLCANLTK